MINYTTTACRIMNYDGTSRPGWTGHAGRYSTAMARDTSPNACTGTRECYPLAARAVEYEQFMVRYKVARDVKKELDMEPPFMEVWTRCAQWQEIRRPRPSGWVTWMVIHSLLLFNHDKNGLGTAVTGSTRTALPSYHQALALANVLKYLRLRTIRQFI